MQSLRNPKTDYWTGFFWPKFFGLQWLLVDFASRERDCPYGDEEFNPLHVRVFALVTCEYEKWGKPFFFREKEGEGRQRLKRVYQEPGRDQVELRGSTRNVPACVKIFRRLKKFNDFSFFPVPPLRAQCFVLGSKLRGSRTLEFVTSSSTLYTPLRKIYSFDRTLIVARLKE